MTVRLIDLRHQCNLRGCFTYRAIVAREKRLRVYHNVTIPSAMRLSKIAGDLVWDGQAKVILFPGGWQVICL